MTAPLFSSQQEIEAFQKRARVLGTRVFFYERARSTNDLALEAARNGAPHGQVFVADAQDAGRGRRGRQWECPPGLGLLFSVLVRPENLPAEYGGFIPLVAGLSCAEALAAFSPRLSAVTVKWPNDIVLPCDSAPGWKKLGGILCESSLPAHSSVASERVYAVIGIGLNVNQTQSELPVTDKAPPTSVRIETDGAANRREMLRIVLERLEENLNLLNTPAQREQMCAAVADKMRAWWTPEKTLSYRAMPADDAVAAVPRTGVFAGLDEFGRIRFEDMNGTHSYADAEIIGVE